MIRRPTRSTLFPYRRSSDLPVNMLPSLCQELAPVLQKDPNVFNWILETDKCMSKGPNNESVPYIWMEIRALKVFDSQECRRSHMSKMFEIVTRLSGLKQEQIHILLGPVDPFSLGVNGAIKE